MIKFYFTHFIARSEYVLFLYITFLGIVPICSIIWIAIWMARHNGGTSIKEYWTKTGSGNTISTYVCGSFTKCLRPVRWPSMSFFSSTKTRTNANSSSFPSACNLLSSRIKKKSTTNKPQAQPYTISGSSSSSISINNNSRSNNVLPGDKISIVKCDLASTTNPRAIDNSNKIEYRRDNDPTTNNHTVNEARNPAKRASPLKTELAIKLAEHLARLQEGGTLPKNTKVPTKTVKKFVPMQFDVNSSSGSVSMPTTNVNNKPSLSATPSAFVSLNNKPPAPFYNKKPPLPPVTPQSLNKTKGY